MSPSSHVFSSSGSDSSDSSSLLGESYSNIWFSSSSFFFVAPCSKSLKLSGSLGWISFWSRYDGRIPTIAIGRTATLNVYPQSLISCMFCGAIGTVDNIWIPLWPTGSWHVRVQGLSSLRLLWLNCQNFLHKLTPCKVDLCNKCITEWALSTSISHTTHQWKTIQ